ncbi:UDP-N-acetylmuramate dehydrogenase [Patescibacteria group bacterium]|nr:UDP-N-acetylmuramate dehydrogenase [Patescibacteria group bacterium]MBU1890755.1 UDP-N-acetylmuramate dehydrogenase [Patescibacteria group bacterium]
MTDIIKEKFPGVITQEPLSKHTTFKIGGPAEFFYKSKTTDDLIKAIKTARELDLPILLLGKGSNILVSDDGIKGLVICLETEGIEREGSKVIVEAGLLLGRLVDWTINNSLAGLEFASGIPGSVGGGIRGNAGAFGFELKDSLESVEALTPDNRRITLTKDECKFGYRDSIFKHTDDIVLTATFNLQQGDKEKSQALVKKYALHRASRQDYSIPSAGCTFKNIPDQPIGKMVEDLGLKGKRIGGAMISETHGNFIVNKGQAKAQDVVDLINLVKEKVKVKYQIDLETEIQLVGF